jgi:hypothetical protein
MLVSFILTSVAALLSCGGSGDDATSTSPQSVLTCSTHQISFDKAAATSTFTVTASKEWSCYSNADWLTCSPTSSIKQSETVTVTVTKNADATSRNSMLVLKSGSLRDTVRISQKGDIVTDIIAPSGYTLAWHDEFDDTPLANGKPAMPSTDKWTYQIANPGFVNNELQYYINGITNQGDTIAKVSGGTLKLRTVKENGNVYSVRMYGNVKNGWKYGYIEARMKLPTGLGTWPAFWMMPVNYTAWPADGEMDIMEEVGYDPDVIHGSLHATNHYGNSPKTGSVNCANSQTEFHKYAMEWTADHISFLVDDKIFYTYNNPGTGKADWPYDSPFYVILNMAWGGTWGGVKGIDEKVLPTTYEIDYVRVFQKK